MIGVEDVAIVSRILSEKEVIAMFRGLKRLFGHSPKVDTSSPEKGIEDPRLRRLIDGVGRGDLRSIEKLADWLANAPLPSLREEAVAALNECLGVADSRVRLAAVSTLPLFQRAARPAVGRLSSLLNDEDADIRRAAAFALPQIGEPKEMPARLVGTLGEDLDHEDLEVRSSAASALSELGSVARPALGALVKCLARDDESSVEAALALRAMGPDAVDAMPGLLGALESPSKDMRARAAEALGAIGTGAASAAPRLIALLEDDPAVASEAFTAINRMGPAAVPALIDGLRGTCPPGVRVKLLNCVGFVGRDAALARPTLEACLNHADEAIRNAAGLALQRIENRSH